MIRLRIVPTVPERFYDGHIRPMPLGFKPQALTHFLEGGFHLPAPYEPQDDLFGLRLEIGAKQSLGLELFLRIAD